jgi:hypothetical protein
MATQARADNPDHSRDLLIRPTGPASRVIFDIPSHSLAEAKQTKSWTFHPLTAAHHLDKQPRPATIHVSIGPLLHRTDVRQQLHWIFKSRRKGKTRIHSFIGRLIVGLSAASAPANSLKRRVSQSFKKRQSRLRICLSYSLDKLNCFFRLEHETVFVSRKRHMCNESVLLSVRN